MLFQIDALSFILNNRGQRNRGGHLICKAVFKSLDIFKINVQKIALNCCYVLRKCAVVNFCISCVNKSHRHSQGIHYMWYESKDVKDKWTAAPSPNMYPKRTPSSAHLLNRWFRLHFWQFQSPFARQKETKFNQCSFTFSLLFYNHIYLSNRHEYQNLNWSISL